MSVDAFGRTLKRPVAGERGPPGIGYKLTADGHYDVDSKKLCNLADPTESSDAVNLNVLRNLESLISSEIGDLSKIIRGLREEIDNLALEIKKQRSEIDDKIKKQRSEIDDNFMNLHFQIENAKSNGNSG